MSQDHIEKQRGHITSVHGEIYFSRDLKVIEHSTRRITTTGGALLVIEDNGDVETHVLPYGAIINVAQGQRVKPATQLTDICPATTPIVAEVSGMLTFIDFVEGVSVVRHMDEVTSLTTYKVIKQKTPTATDQSSKTSRRWSSKRLKPRILIETQGKFHACTGVLPLGTLLFVNLSRDEHPVMRGDIIARIPKA